MNRIFGFEIEGRRVLGFDTGLNAQAFAQAKMAQFITESGFIVKSGGEVTEWRAEGVLERPKNGTEESSMVIWGPAFEGERFDLLLNAEASGAPPAAAGPYNSGAVEALRLWINSRSALGDRQAPLWPAAALINLRGNDAGTILFPPERLVRRCLQAEGSWLGGAAAFVYPGLEGEAGAAFTAAAALYRILSGKPAFEGEDEEALHQNIREAVFLPPSLACPGLDDTPAGLMKDCLGSPEKQHFNRLRSFLNGSEPSSWFKSLSAEERARLEAEKEQFQKKKALKVNTRRFIIRNTAIIIGVVIAMGVAGLIAGSVISGRKDLPTTKGMEPVQVVRSYYTSFGTLDHSMMEACTVKGAGKSDIGMVTNFFVISKVRQAYEFNEAPGIVPAQEWVDTGENPAGRTVFGVSDLMLEKLEDGEATQHFRASYMLWTPQSGEDPENIGAGDPDGGPFPPQGRPYTDELTLTKLKDAWRISEINRSER
jgi:hypothetical protein